MTYSIDCQNTICISYAFRGTLKACKAEAERRCTPNNSRVHILNSEGKRVLTYFAARDPLSNYEMTSFVIYHDKKYLLKGNTLLKLLIGIVFGASALALINFGYGVI